MMKQLLTIIFAITSISAFSQYKNMNQKLNFVNGFKVSDTVRTDSAAIFGSGQFLKIQDTTASEWNVIRGSLGDAGFFNRSNNKLTPKNAGDTIEAAGLDLNGLSGSGTFLQIGADNRVFKSEGDTSFFLKSGNYIQVETSADTLDLTTKPFKMGGYQNNVGQAPIDNFTGGLKTLSIVDVSRIDTIFYGDPSSAGLRPLVDSITMPLPNTIITLVGGLRDNQADSSVVLIDRAPLFLNGNDTLRYKDCITLFYQNAGSIIEISRSDNQ